MHAFKKTSVLRAFTCLLSASEHILSVVCLHGYDLRPRLLHPPHLEILCQSADKNNMKTLMEILSLMGIFVLGAVLAYYWEMLKQKWRP